MPNYYRMYIRMTSSSRGFLPSAQEQPQGHAFIQLSWLLSLIDFRTAPQPFRVFLHLNILITLLTARAHARVCVCRSQNNLQQSVLSFPSVDPRDQTQDCQALRQVPLPTAPSRRPLYWRVLMHTGQPCSTASTSRGCLRAFPIVTLNYSFLVRIT